MTTPLKASCVHVTNVTVVEPFQLCYDGTTYVGGDTVVDVPAALADNWIANNWATRRRARNRPNRRHARPAKRRSTQTSRAVHWRPKPS